MDFFGVDLIDVDICGVLEKDFKFVQVIIFGMFMGDLEDVSENGFELDDDVCFLFFKLCDYEKFCCM